MICLTMSSLSLIYYDCNYGGDETRSGYMRYAQGIQPNVPAGMCTYLDTL